MSIFKKPAAGGFMDEIRCDEPSYLIWKWHPRGSQSGNNNRENAIRWGSSLRVKDGEVAVFVYNHKNGIMQDFIEGPFDQIIKTSNFPVLASIVGLAYDGGTPFQAEVYFINLAKIIQIPFAVPYFDLYDPRYLDFGVPTAVRGKLTFNIKDYRQFIKLHRLSDFSFDAFQFQIRDAISRYVKDVVANTPSKKNIPVVQIEREIGSINGTIEEDIRERFEDDFGISVTAVDINAIEIDKSSYGYAQLKAITADIASATTKAQAEINIKNMQDMQKINAENVEETLRIQREEAQYAQHKQSQSANFSAYQLEKQAEVGVAGAEALGKMGANGATEMGGGGSGGMNPAAMMAGMAMGGAIGQNMAGMMNGMMQGVNAAPQTPGPGMTPPPMPGAVYHIAIGSQPSSPMDMNTLSQMVSSGALTKESLVWKQGMENWVKAGEVHELEPIFGATPPPVPGMPNIPNDEEK